MQHAALSKALPRGRHGHSIGEYTVSTPVRWKDVVARCDGEFLLGLQTPFREGKCKISHRRLGISRIKQVVLQMGMLPVKRLRLIVIAIPFFRNGEGDELCLRPFHQIDCFRLSSHPLV